MTQQFEVTRRNFVVGSAAAGAGFCLGFYAPQGVGKLLAATEVPEVNAWVVINPDDTVIIRVARSEMGQGSLTGLAQLVAEELECDWSKVTTEYPTPGQSLARDRVWGSFSTGGSQGIRKSHEYVRKGGAAARDMLVRAAAKRWKAEPSECRTAKSIITHEPSGRTTTYGEVAAEASKLEPPFDVFLKDPEEWTIAGKSLPRLDTADKVTGKQVYGTDLRLPGMLNAAIKACPVFGGKVESLDESKVSNMPGVRKVVRVGDSAVAVVADTWWRANSALDALPITWDFGPNANASSADIDASLKDGLEAKDAFVGNKAGDIDKAFGEAAKTIDAEYGYPYQAHATMEPMNATALWTPDKCEVWCPTQNGEAALSAAAKASGLPAAKCEVYKIHLGGGFGRRGAFQDFVEQAVTIARQMPGTPIKLIWSREEDMTHDHYHPITRSRFVGALDKGGNLTALRVRISGQSILAGVMPGRLNDGMDPFVFQGLLPDGDHAFTYDVPNLLFDHAMRNPHVPPGFWRAVNINQNALYLESFIDDLAHAAGTDPLAFRQKLLAKTPKALAVLNAAAERVGWTKPAEKGIGRGLAVSKTFASYVAACAEVSVSTAGELKVHRIVFATDPGHAVNPRQIEMQAEGCCVYSLSALLYGECTVKGGRVEQSNFHNYEVMRLAEMPEVETIIMPSGGFWGGVGEPSMAVAAPAVLNAIFAATGKRIRQVPLKNANLKAG